RAGTLQRDAERRLAERRTGKAAYDRAITQGHDALAQGRFADAAAAFGEALRLEPGDAEAIEGLQAARGRAPALAAGQVRGGRGVLDRLLADGAAAPSRREFADAERFYADALRTAPGDPRARSGLRQARYGQAMDDGRRALAARQRAAAVRAYEAALAEV